MFLIGNIFTYREFVMILEKKKEFIRRDIVISFLQYQGRYFHSKLNWMLFEFWRQYFNLVCISMCINSLPIFHEDYDLANHSGPLNTHYKEDSNWCFYFSFISNHCTVLLWLLCTIQKCYTKICWLYFAKTDQHHNTKYY